MGFKEIALPLAAKNIPCTPVLPNSKKAFIPDWPTSATTNQEQILNWDAQYSNCNGACVARAEIGGIWIFEVDRRGILQQIEEETGQSIPPTFAVRSSPGKGHLYFRQTPASIAMGNCQAKDEQGELWSARVDKRYCVAPGSYHPSGGRYEILHDTEIQPAPEWLINWCIKKAEAKKTGQTGHIELDSEEPISEGGRNNALASILGKARQVLKMDYDELLHYGLSKNQKRCKPPLSEDEVKIIAGSIVKYPISPSTDLVFTQPVASIISAPVAIVKRPYPEFPIWVMRGTSLYRNFVEPVCAKNPARISYFMFMPAITLLLNYLGTKVQIGVKQSMALRNIPLSLFMVLVGQRGQTKKSSCIDDAINYFHFMGLTSHANMDVKTAEGRSLIWTPGSTEGFGLGMQRSQCKNGIILYDELSVLERKASIESSTLPQTLLTGYESKKLSNSTKKTKEVFDLEPGAYVLSFLAGCTRKKFLETWAVLSKGSDGLDDRFTLILQPETLAKSTPYQAADVLSKANETRALIDKAVSQKMFHIVDDGPLVQAISELGFTDREEIRAEKYALAFAIDLGLVEIDEDCIERGIAVVQYERAVKRNLYAVDTENKSAALQLKTRQKLEDLVSVAPDHKVKKRDLQRKLNADRWGTHLWGQVFSGLVNAGIVGQDNEGNVWVIEKLGELDEGDE